MSGSGALARACGPNGLERARPSAAGVQIKRELGCPRLRQPDPGTMSEMPRLMGGRTDTALPRDERPHSGRRYFASMRPVRAWAEKARLFQAPGPRSITTRLTEKHLCQPSDGTRHRLHRLVLGIVDKCRGHTRESLSEIIPRPVPGREDLISRRTALENKCQRFEGFDQGQGI